MDVSAVVGLTSTIPVEVVLAAGLKPLDLNNLFITSPERERLVVEAERAGFSHNICAWIKGIYATVMKHRIHSVIAVTGGDCSSTVALAEVLERRGIRVISFDYPRDRDRDSLRKELENLMEALGATWEGVETAKVRLDRIRAKLRLLDRLTYREGVVSGAENHRFLVSSSDFGSDADEYELQLQRFLQEVTRRNPIPETVRVGLLGVPPISDGIHDFLESVGCRVVFNEVQRQFSIPFETPDLVERYLAYTYPYGIEARIRDIRQGVQERALDGLIHYTQTFCYRQIYDLIFRESFSLPLLTVEGDRPGNLDGRTQVRLESFVEMLKMRKEEFP